MGKTILNSALGTLRGGVDKWIYRRRCGTIMVAKRPDFSQVVPSANQLAHRARFEKGVAYAKAVIADPVRVVPYAAAAKGTLASAFVLAVGDFVGLPEVKEVDVTQFTGHPASKVKIDATDDFKVATVKVTICETDTGALVETGPAVLVEGYWIYTATTESPRDKTLTIEAEASDLAGNQRTLSEAWHG